MYKFSVALVVALKFVAIDDTKCVFVEFSRFCREMGFFFLITCEFRLWVDTFGDTVCVAKSLLSPGLTVAFRAYIYQQWSLIVCLDANLF